MLIRLVAATSLTFYGVLALAPDGATASVEAQASDEPQIMLASFAPTEPIRSLLSAPGDFEFSTLVDQLRSTRPLPAESVSDAEAIRIALARGQEIRAARASDAPRLRGGVEEASAAEALEAEPAATAELWRVTGSVVNVRSGPSTGAAVVDQVRAGDEVRVTGERSAAWVQIDAPETGPVWIYGTFLERVAAR